jgi:hypothetical protein
VGICWGIHVMIFFLVSGLGSAVSIRISNELGGGGASLDWADYQGIIGLQSSMMFDSHMCNNSQGFACLMKGLAVYVDVPAHFAHEAGCDVTCFFLCIRRGF